MDKSVDYNLIIKNMLDNINKFWDYGDKYKDYVIPFNCLLVLNNIRKSFMIQWIDYNEQHPDSLKTKTFIDGIKTIFPNSFNFVTINQGVLVMKKTVEVDFDVKSYTDKQLGDFLSYPCSGDIAEIGPNDSKYGLDYILKIEESEHHTINIISMVCKEKTDLIDQFTNKLENFVDKFNRLSKQKIQLVMELDMLYSIPYLMDHIKKEKLDREMEDQIFNLFLNFNYPIFLVIHSEKILDVFDKKYKFVLLAVFAHIYAEHINNLRVYNLDHENKDLSVKTDAVITLFDQLVDIKIDKIIRCLTIDAYEIKS